MSRFEKTKERIRNLTRIDKVFLIALILRITYGAFATAAGYPLPGDGLVRFFFIVAAILFLIRSFPKLVRTLLWRVRHRLLVTWIFVGVVPIVLIVLLLAEGTYFLMGQFVGYMTTNELRRKSEAVAGSASVLAWSIDHRPASVSAAAAAESFVKETSGKNQVEFGAVVRAGGRTVVAPANGLIQEIPAWSEPGYAGIVKAGEDYYFAAYMKAADGSESFAYQLAPPAVFARLLPGVATVQADRGLVNAGGIDIQRTERPRSGITIQSSRRPDDPDVQPVEPPPGRGWWDIPINWFVIMPARNLTDGKTGDSLAVVASRPSLITKSLFSNLGQFAFVPLFMMIATAVALLLVELISFLFGAKLTRSITRAVADLYEGTRKIQAGDFSHRIPVRKTKDQLSELAGSFNIMTGRIQDLIGEVKEKERLENELKIAHDVQSQLFPKETPRLKTLELWGGCQPARSVSGDYYDFVPIGPDRTALAIGDISGKGISAALLMAHMQSALRSQLMLRDKDGKPAAAMNGLLTSPSSVIAVLNDLLYSSSPPEKYATFFLGLYSDDAGQLLYTNAGHLAPILVRRGEAQRLAGEGFPVGLFPGIQYEQQSLALQPGDLIVGFTDGVTETPNREGEEFGDQRLTELLMRHVHKPLDVIAGEITVAVEAWSAGAERHDDTTLLLGRRV